MKKTISILLALFSISSVTMTVSAQSNDMVLIQQYITEETEKLQETAEATLTLEDGTTITLTPDVTVEKIGQLPNSKARKSIDPADGLYKATVRASQSKSATDTRPEVKASVTIVAYYTRNGLNLTCNKQYYAFDYDASKATIVKRAFVINNNNGFGYKATPTSNNGTYTYSMEGKPGRPVTVGAQLGYKNKSTGQTKYFGAQVTL